MGLPIPSNKGRHLKTDLVSCTFVFDVASADIGDSSGVVPRIVKAVRGNPASFFAEVNIFKQVLEVVGQRDNILMCQGVAEKLLRHIPEIVQTMELKVITMTDITNMAFVYTEAFLKDTLNFYFTCQRLENALPLRYRINPRIKFMSGGWKISNILYQNANGILPPLSIMVV